MSNLKQLRPIDPNSEANDGPGDGWTEQQNADFAASRAKNVARAMARHTAPAANWTPEVLAQWNAAQAYTTPTADLGWDSPRAIYRASLRLAIASLESAARINPAQEHALMMLLTDAKGLYAAA